MTISASSSIPRCRDDQQKLFTLAELKRRHEQFARLWDRNLRAQGYYEAFVRSRSR